jgi:hypothetical protein
MFVRLAISPVICTASPLFVEPEDSLPAIGQQRPGAAASIEAQVV